MDDRPLIDIAEYEDARPVHTSNYTRSGNDFYPTPDWVTQALLDNASLRGPVWEPCCGGGAMVRPIERRGYRVEATDIADHGYGRSGIDFMACRSVPAGCQSIVTNPPYGDGTVERGATKSARMLLSFVDHAIRLTEQNGGQLALLVRYTWIAGKRASTLISAGPLDRVLVLTRRICWFDLGPATKQGQHHHCWLFFDAQRDRAKPPEIVFV